MSELIYGCDEELAAWAAAQMPHVAEDGFGACKAIGVAVAGKPAAAVIYHNWTKRYGVCEVSIAAVDPRWATRGTIRALLSVPFEQYGCRKIYATIPTDNPRAIRLITGDGRRNGLGFKRDGVLRHHFAKGRHAAIFSMMRSEYEAKWVARRRAVLVAA